MKTQREGVSARELGLLALTPNTMIICGGCAAIRGLVPIPLVWVTAALAIHALALVSRTAVPGSRAAKRLAGTAADWAGDLRRVQPTKEGVSAVLKWLVAPLFAAGFPASSTTAD